MPDSLEPTSADEPQNAADQTPEAVSVDAGDPAKVEAQAEAQVDAAATPEVEAAPDAEPELDEVLAASQDLARTALLEITSEDTIGAFAGALAEADHVASLRFECTMPAYPHWYWTVTLARVEDAEPTVMELELLPGEGALLAPPWVPWSVRLAEYQAAKAAGELEEDIEVVADDAVLDDEDESDEDGIDGDDDSDHDDDADDDDADDDADDDDADDDADDDGYVDVDDDVSLAGDDDEEPGETTEEIVDDDEDDDE